MFSSKPNWRHAVGKLVFDKEVDGKQQPLHNILVNLLDDDYLSSKNLGTARTDMDGNFDIKYDRNAINMFDKPDLRIVIQMEETYYNENGDIIKKLVDLPSFKGTTHNNVDDVKFDFGTIKVACYEYITDGRSCTPRVDNINFPLPNNQRKGRKRAGLGTLSKFIAVKTGLKSYPLNETRLMGEVSQGDKHFVEYAINGFSPFLLKVRDDDTYFIDIKYDGYQQDTKHFGANSTALFKKKGDDLVLTGIEVEKRVGNWQPRGNATLSKPKLYTPDNCSEEMWKRVKFLWRTNAFTFGQAVTHVADCHFNIEQYLIPVMRNVRLNPIVSLLSPHFQGTLEVNVGTNKLLSDPDQMIGSASALTPDSVQNVVRDAFGTRNWFGFSPRQPICESHTYAKAANIFWDLLKDYVNEFFSKHEKEIKNHWNEIHLMSKDLIRNAVPLFKEPFEFYDTNEVNPDDAPRAENGDGVTAAVSPVTKSDTCNDNDYSNLKQMCCYVLFKATFQHHHVHDHQFQVAGDTSFALFGFEYDLLLDEERSLDDVASAAVKQKQLDLAFVLPLTKYGLILKNEDGDINPDFAKRVAEKRDEFAKLGYDADLIRCVINS
eukprot:TRINITY_DN594_c11_g1_i1.p1 TRINITY_DN594_c11_g1~~TRINITY_DN594_c11_g1_i1.p1  ORF type:complete len:603 (+),score=135.34 TRINITY_DN594_c11_g1_i1:68-1876(+)